MKYLCFLPLLALSAAAGAQSGTERQGTGQTIIVTGTSLPQTERNLRDCLARKCPPDQDVAASLAHAENLFVAGNFRDAGRVTRESLDRNRRHAAAYPVPVSDLYRADGRIAMHLGKREDYENSTWGIKRALQAGLPRTDPRLVGAKMEIAAMKAAIGRFEAAQDGYKEAARDALAIDRPDLAAMARVQAAWLYALAGSPAITRRLLREVADDRSPQVRVPRLTALLLLDRLDRKEGKDGISETLIAELRGAGLRKPVLLFAPPIKLESAGPSSQAVGSMSGGNLERLWVDVGFWVTPQGRVSELEILRSSGPTDWAEPVIKSIAGRLYSPAADGVMDGTYRIERYTYTAFLQTATGTRLRQRSSNARVEYLDLTAEPEARRN